MKISISNICSAFEMNTVGTKVVSRTYFMACLEEEITKAKFGDGVCVVPCDAAIVTVTCGVAKRENVPISGYVAREHRGEVILCAKRLFASTPESLNVVVYERDRYVRESQVSTEEAARILKEEADYVIVAVLASAGEGRPPVSSHRFVRNLAGGNKDYSPENGYTLEKAIAQAKEVAEYEQNWVTVAD